MAYSRLPRHPNRRQHNWLIYEQGEAFLQQYRHLFRGNLYDLGCGEMAYREWFLQFIDSYTGVDWSNTPHRLRADIISDLNGKLPIEDGAADTVISLSVMEHLHDPQLFLREAFRILKPGGTMVLQVPFMWWVHEAPHDYFRFTKFGLRHLFQKAGFSEEMEIHSQTGFWVMWTLKFNYQTRRLIRGPWPIRAVTKLLLNAIWAINQRVAPWMDHHWKCEEESAGYYVIARKA